MKASINESSQLLFKYVSTILIQRFQTAGDTCPGGLQVYLNPAFLVEQNRVEMFSPYFSTRTYSIGQQRRTTRLSGCFLWKEQYNSALHELFEQ